MLTPGLGATPFTKPCSSGLVGLDGMPAASACESARILLNSRSTRFPQGLGNSSGTVGKYLTDTTGTDVAGFIPAMVDHVPHNEEGVGGAHIYMPWWLDNKQLGFPRGYHIEVWGGLGVPSYGFMGGIHRYPSGGGYGAPLKDDYRRYYGATIGFSGRGEMIPNEQSFCEIAPGVKDRWGIPVLRFHWKWSDHELNQVRHMQETFRAILETMGGRIATGAGRGGGRGALATRPHQREPLTPRCARSERQSISKQTAPCATHAGSLPKHKRDGP